MRINNNLLAMNTHRQLGIATDGGAKSMEKLSSGFRINRAGDDAAGLAISEKMRGQIRGLTQASRNAQDGISLIQTAEGALNETHAILQRMRELAVQSSTDTNTDDDREKIQSEVDELAKEITRISNTTEFNTQNLMAGGLDNTFHIGANERQNVGLKISAMDAHTLGVAASKIDTSIANANGIEGIKGVTADLGVDAKINIEVQAATQTVEQGEIEGTVGLEAGSEYTGITDKTIEFKISTVDTNGVVTAIEVDGQTISVDGGAFDLDEGIKITIGEASTNETGQNGSVEVKAKYAEIKLSNSGGDIGAAVRVHGDKTGVVVGDAATNRTANISFDFDELVDGDVSITQSIDASSSAKTDALGNVTTNAEVKAGVNVSTQASADNAITTINNALERVSEERGKLGAMQNRLEHTIKNLDTSAENLQASEARIRDVDMAKEIMEFTKQNILQQAATAMLAQANMAPQSVLQLLG